jgi:D-alanine--poly(phosphoribitol) ligase subunit 1
VIPPRYYTDVASLFVDVAAEHRDRSAIRWSADAVTTYGELDRLSNQVARVLIDRGVRKRDTVGIAVDKSDLTYAVMLACLKLGAVYFAVDPSNPPTRIRAIAARCEPAFAFIGASEQAALLRCETALVPGGMAPPPWLLGVDTGPVGRPGLDGSDPAYVMFTSGSTGTPKGVTISHGNLLNFIRWTQTQYHTTPSDVFTGLNPLFFDNSVFDFYASLFAGAGLVPFTTQMVKDATATLRRIDDLGCTIYFSVPSLIVYFQRLKRVDRESFRSLRAMLFGGEGYPKPMLARLHDAIGDRVALHNVYGPTECTCICSSYQVMERDLVDVTGYAPLGHLAPNFSGVVLDEHGRSVDAGGTGELYLGGPCVGLGYYNDPDQSAGAFVQNPTHTRFFDRMYRTGDLVRIDAGDGRLHFAGRVDTQIKRQGYRIELAEVEHALTADSAVEEAAAVHVISETASRIVAVVASNDPGVAERLRRVLPEALPKYMIPDRITVVGELPKNANGKIDRKAIAEELAANSL